MSTSVLIQHCVRNIIIPTVFNLIIRPIVKIPIVLVKRPYYEDRCYEDDRYSGPLQSVSVVVFVMGSIGNPLVSVAIVPYMVICTPIMYVNYVATPFIGIILHPFAPGNSPRDLYKRFIIHPWKRLQRIQSKPLVPTTRQVPFDGLSDHPSRAITYAADGPISMPYPDSWGQRVDLSLGLLDDAFECSRRMIARFLSGFPNMEVLYIETHQSFERAYRLKRRLIPRALLKCLTDKSNPEVIQLSPRLRQLHIHSWTMEAWLLRIVLGHHPVLESLILKHRIGVAADAREELFRFLRGSGSSTLMKFTMCLDALAIEAEASMSGLFPQISVPGESGITLTNLHTFKLVFSVTRLRRPAAAGQQGTFLQLQESLHELVLRAPNLSYISLLKPSHLAFLDEPDENAVWV